MKIRSLKTKRKISEESGGWCELCRKEQGIHIHHEPSKGSAYLETRLTLVRLGVHCHNKRHYSGVNRPDIVELICRRENVLPIDRGAVISLLKRAPFKKIREAQMEWFTWQSLEWPESAQALLRKTLLEAGVK